MRESACVINLAVTMHVCVSVRVTMCLLLSMCEGDKEHG